MLSLFVYLKQIHSQFSAQHPLSPDLYYQALVYIQLLYTTLCIYNFYSHITTWMSNAHPKVNQNQTFCPPNLFLSQPPPSQLIHPSRCSGKNFGVILKSSLIFYPSRNPTDSTIKIYLISLVPLESLWSEPWSSLIWVAAQLSNHLPDLLQPVIDTTTGVIFLTCKLFHVTALLCSPFQSESKPNSLQWPPLPYRIGSLLSLWPHLQWLPFAHSARVNNGFFTVSQTHLACFWLRTCVPAVPSAYNSLPIDIYIVIPSPPPSLCSNVTFSWGHSDHLV